MSLIILLPLCSLQLVQNGSRTPSQCDSPSALQVLREESDEGSPLPKRFKHLEKVIEQRWKENLEKSAQLPPGKAEVERYFTSTVTLSERIDPVTFWLQNESQYPLLSPIAIDLLCIPASSAPVERTFSVASESTTGKRNTLSDKNLEREIMIRNNKHYL